MTVERKKKRKLNAQIKQLDAAVRLVVGRGKKEAEVVVSQGGVMYSAGLDAGAPTSGLPRGVYRADQIVEACKLLKYADSLEITSAGDAVTGWQVVLGDTAPAECAAQLDWRDCEISPVTAPEAPILVDTLLRKHIKAAYSLAARLKKRQARYAQFYANGVFRYVSMTCVADWWDAERVNQNAPQSLLVDVASLKRASAYRGGKLAAIGESDGKTNFVYDDGAFLRVDAYDGAEIAPESIEEKFQLPTTDTYRWPLSAGEPGETFLSLIETGAERSGTEDGVNFSHDLTTASVPTAMPIHTSLGGFNRRNIAALAEYADYIAPSGPQTPWKDGRILFFGGNGETTGYRAMVSTAFVEDEARQRGLL